ncbi:MAG: tetratricopeptide repeat protein [Promethearchaeota archaeon]
MSSLNQNTAIKLTVTRFPQNLLIPNGENLVTFQVRNNSGKKGDFKFSFEGENLNVSLNTEEFANKITIDKDETKTIDLLLTPTADGLGKLIINVYWLKFVEYTIKVQKIRDSVPSNNANAILGTKQFLPTDFEDNFNPNEFFGSNIKGESKRIEKVIKSLQDSQDENSLPQNDQLTSANLVKEIDSNLKELAKIYLETNDFYKALETALKLSIENEKIQFYYNLIRAYAIVDFDQCIQIISKLNDVKRKYEIIQNLGLDFVLASFDKVDKLLALIENEDKKQKVLMKIIGKASQKSVEIALKLLKHVSKETVKVNILFNFIKILHDNKVDDQILTLINNIINIMVSSNFKENNFENPDFHLFEESIHLLAELDCPESADSTIKGISDKDVRDKITRDLFDEIYVMIDEIKTKIEPTVIFSQYYTLNVLTSKISKEIKDFSFIGGNVSNNVLMNDFNFNITFITLFGLDFSIFPFIDRVYADLKNNSHESFAYYIYPSISNHNEEELQIMQSTLTRFFPINKMKSPITIFNLDFIPYLGKPTIILSKQNSQLITSKIQKKLADRVKLIVDNDLFEGGKAKEFLDRVFYSNNITVFNLILSYEFINDYNILKAFIEALI